jgi:hypothetical protein
MAVLDRIPALYTPTLAVDIRDTLRANDGEVTDNLLSFFQPDANIDMWSLRKPYFNNKIGVLENSEAQTAGKKIDGYEGVTTCRYGLSIAGGLGVTPLDLYNNVGKNGAVSYHLPEGGELSPYRLSDFCGYNPKASMPISGAYQGTQKITQAEAVALDFVENINQSDGSIKFEDLYGSATGWRKAAILVEENPENLLRPVKDVQIDEISSVFTGLYPNKTFKVVQFITTLPSGTTVPASGNANGWKDYVQYAIPNGTFTLEIEKREGSGGGGTVNPPSYGGFFVAFTENPRFIGPDANPYSSIKVSFSITSAGESTINALSVYVYSDRNYTSEIKRVSLIEESFELYGTRTFTSRIDNSGGNTNVWVRIVVNGTPKIGSVVEMPFNEIE